MRIPIHALVLAFTLAPPAAILAQEPDGDAVARGAQVWADNCTRCHNARAPQERSDAAWQTILLHMRARANLTRTDAALVTAFMQATNLPEPAAAVAATPESAAAGGTPPEPEDGQEGEPDGGSDGGSDGGPGGGPGSDGAQDDGPPDFLTLIRYLESLSGR